MEFSNASLKEDLKGTRAKLRGEAAKGEEKEDNFKKEEEPTVNVAKLLNENQGALASNATPATMAFMERLRKYYNDAVRERTKQKKADETVFKRNEGPEIHADDILDAGNYHLADSFQSNDRETSEAGASSCKIHHIPTPVPIPTGDLADVMKDVIRSQNEQPWLISSEARVPTVSAEEAIVAPDQCRQRNEISKKLQEELAKKHGAADSWAKNNAAPSKTSSRGGRPQQFHKMRSQRERFVVLMRLA